MDSNITAALIGAAFLAFSGLVGWIWTLHDRIAQLKCQHLEFKLEVALKYASIPYLKDVEERLVTTIDKLSDVIDKLRENIGEVTHVPRFQDNR